MLDPKIKRLVLKPLAKRKNRAASADVYTRALARLDERALGEDSVRQLRDAITPTEREKRNSNWKDETRARQLVDLASALYSSRRISTSEYVFYAARPVEDIHSARWLDGYYDIKLRPIDNALDAIKEKHGLGPDEDWHRGDGPEEHTQLNIQYETFLDHQFIKLLEEYGLHDLAKLKVENKKEFDRLRERGRRTVFHRNEFSFSVRDVVIRFENEASQAANASAYSAAVICLGAAIEGLLLLRCLRSSKKAERVSRSLAKRLRPRSPIDASTWTFETLIEVCLAAGWLPPVETPFARYDPAGLAHILRLMRNYVHPGRQARERPWSEAGEREYKDANAIYMVLFSILGKISSTKPSI